MREGKVDPRGVRSETEEVREAEVERHRLIGRHVLREKEMGDVG